MKPNILTIAASAAILLSGCSSKEGAMKPTLPDIDDSPQWGLDIGDTPDWGLTDPDFGVPDTGETPDRMPPLWGGMPDSEHTPERFPPIWGGPELPPIDNGPEASYTISGNTITDANGNIYNITSVDWREQGMMVTDTDGNEYEIRIIRQGDYEGDFGIIINGESIIIGGDTIQGGLRPLMEGVSPSLDKNTIRDTIRARLN